MNAGMRARTHTHTAYGATVIDVYARTSKIATFPTGLLGLPTSSVICN